MKLTTLIERTGRIQRTFLFVSLLLVITSPLHSQIITTIGGTGSPGYSGDGGDALLANMKWPNDVVVDANNMVYLSDRSNNVVRRIDQSTGIITTIAGTGVSGFSGDGGPATSARLYSPTGLTLDGSGNLYIAENNNYRIRKVNLGTGIITTVAGNGSAGSSGDGGPATSASINYPFGVAVDAAGNLYIGEVNGHRIRKVDGATGIISTLAGTGTWGFSGDGGPATTAQIAYPRGMCVDNLNRLLFADRINHRIRAIDLSTGTITTVAGTGAQSYCCDGGPAISAELDNPFDVCVDASNNFYIADANNDRIRMVDGSGTITTIAGIGTYGYTGDGGLATDAELNFPLGVDVDASGSVYIADQSNHVIRKIVQDMVLPVELTAFNATRVGKSAHLTWTTASEFNTDYFEVLRSDNGITWDIVNRTEAVGNSTSEQHYMAVDPTLNPGIWYYQLKQIDNDGQKRYSEVRTVSVSGDYAVIINENPVNSGELHITITDPSVDGTLIVSDTRGTILYSGVATQPCLKIDVTSWSSGVYMVQYRTLGTSEIERVLITGK